MKAKPGSSLVCSWGGVGTTAVLEFLESLPGYSVNPSSGYLNPLKHPLRPPDGAERAVFLFGCPELSLLSLFRRGYDRLHYVNVNDLFPKEMPYPHGNLWALTCRKFGLRELEPGVWANEEGQFADRCGALDWLEERKSERARAEAEVDRLALAAYRTFEDLLDKGVDVFRRLEQLRNWAGGASYPVLLVRYESLWQRLHEVLEFLQVPRNEWDRFPSFKPRSSNLDQLSSAQLRKLRLFCRDLNETVSNLPDLHRPG